MMTRFALLLMTVCAAAPAGCLDRLRGPGEGVPKRTDRVWGPLAEAPKPASTTPLQAPTGQNGPASAVAAATKNPSYKLVVTLRLTTIEVPVGTASGSEEIWSYLDEEPVKAVRSASLGRNGLRVGLGRMDNWPDLARIFKRMTGQSPKQNMIATIPGDPLPIILKERQEEQTIFTFHDDRTLSGRDYPPGDYLLAAVCTLDEDDVSKVLLTAMPQVRTTHRRTRFVMGQAGPEIMTESEVHGLAELTFRLMVPSKGLVVIGPGAASRNPTTAGYHFLVRKKEGVEFEMLLVLIPEVLAAPAK